MQRREAAALFALRHEDAVFERQCLLGAGTSAQPGSPAAPLPFRMPAAPLG